MARFESTPHGELVILDYGAGNLTSVRLAFERAGVQPLVTGVPADLARAERIVFPGVGAAASGMAGLRERGLDDALREAAATGKPILAICLGMQLLFDASDEDGGVAGLGLMAGRAVRFDFHNRPERVKVPHMGWNPMRFPLPHPLLAGIPDNSAFYFVHAYHVVPGWADPALPAAAAPASEAAPVAPGKNGRVLGVCEYAGLHFAAIAGRGSVFAVQGHPERSGEAGAALLRNFLDWDGKDGAKCC